MRTPVPASLIQCSHICLRQPTMADADWIFTAYATDDEVTQYLHWESHESIDETVAYLGRCEKGWADRTEFSWIIEQAEGGGPVGMIAMRIVPPKADVGYVIARDSWGMGYATEAVEALKNWALAQDDLYRFWAVCDTDNVGSARVLEKAGLQCEGTLRNWIFRPGHGGRICDCQCWAAIK